MFHKGKNERFMDKQILEAKRRSRREWLKRTGKLKRLKKLEYTMVPYHKSFCGLDTVLVGKTGAELCPLNNYLIDNYIQRYAIFKLNAFCLMMRKAFDFIYYNLTHSKRKILIATNLDIYLEYFEQIQFKKGILSKFALNTKLWINGYLTNNRINSNRRLPSVVICLTPSNDFLMVHEASLKKIPVVSLLRSTDNVLYGDYCLFLDDSLRAPVDFFLNMLFSLSSLSFNYSKRNK